jgi:hypothetical protein
MTPEKFLIQEAEIVQEQVGLYMGAGHWRNDTNEQVFCRAE